MHWKKSQAIANNRPARQDCASNVLPYFFLMETPITPRSMSNRSTKNPRNTSPWLSPAIRPPALQATALQATARQDYASNVLPYFLLTGTPITPRRMSNKRPERNPGITPPWPSPAIRPPALQATARQNYASIVLPYFFLMETPITPRSMSSKSPEEPRKHACAAKPGNQAAARQATRKAGLRLYRPAVFFPDGNADHAKKHEQQNARRASRPCLAL